MSTILSGLLDSILDASVVFSFDRSGYRRHARRFDPKDLDVDLAGKTALVTGANSGIGKAAAMGLARLGARVVLLCRDEARGLEALEELKGETGNGLLELIRLDVSDLGDIRQVAAGLGGENIDILVHNAGVLPDRRVTTRDGLEVTLATNLVGPFLLTGLLLQALERAGGRVVHVSSGGMYTQRLDVDGLFRGSQAPFDGVVQYARTKRALVVLNELLAKRLSGSGVTFSAMHPVWADTPAVRMSLPRFHAVTKGILRSPDEGADTVVWLAASRAAGRPSGLFWFDRAPAPTTPIPENSKPRRSAGGSGRPSSRPPGSTRLLRPGKPREAGGAELGVLEVDVLRPERAVHRAVVHGAVDESGRVPELVGHLHTEAVQEDRLP
ncbi:MAG: SDR family NAD(P)-dependent oxidoreductase [Holophagales bacterium]|nr:SDR family NAD(P)-dependent oxidoreductase [Holophagales bacterium]